MYKSYVIIMAVLFAACLGTEGQAFRTSYNYDYSQTLVMKLGISVPDGKGGTKIINTFDDALVIIKTADELSLGVPKILYLVGWQYNGHNDKYPAFFEVNKALKRYGGLNLHLVKK